MKKVILEKDQTKIYIEASVQDNATKLNLVAYYRDNVWRDWTGMIPQVIGGSFSRCEEVVQRFQAEDPKRRVARSGVAFNCAEFSIVCYTQPQIERAYQALLELWEAIKLAAATPSPKAIVAKNKLEELGFK